MKKVLIDCMEEIPCNPCEYACPKGAITIGPQITALPKVDEEKCNGCGTCIASCPGQACFVIDEEYSLTEGSIDLPYEYYPLPEVDQRVTATNNQGEIVCEGRIGKVLNLLKNNHTPIVRVIVPKSKVREVRSFRQFGDA